MIFMRLLGVFHCIDIINYHMLQAMRGKGIETYATYTSDEEREALPKECVALRIPHFKVNLNMPLSRRCVRL